MAFAHRKIRYQAPVEPFVPGIPEEKASISVMTLIMRLIVPVVGLLGMVGLLGYILYFADDPSTPQLIPVIKAEPGPVRVKPENPGGQSVLHQDKLVYERLGTNAAAPEASATLLPTAEDPIEVGNTALPLLPVAPLEKVAASPTMTAVKPEEGTKEIPAAVKEVVTPKPMAKAAVVQPSAKAAPKMMTKSAPKVVTKSSIKKPPAPAPRAEKTTTARGVKIRGDILGRLKKMQAALG